MIEALENKHREAYETKSHTHIFDQILFLDEANQIEIANEEIVLDKRALVFLPETINHKIKSDRSQVVLGINFKGEELDSLNRDILSLESFKKPLLIEVDWATWLNLIDILKYMRHQQRVQDKMTPFNLAASLSQILLILYPLITNHQRVVQTISLPEQIKIYLDRYYYKIHSNQDLADKFHYSSRHVVQVFSESYGLTPLQYLKELRVQMAIEALTSSEDLITLICFDLGYDSQATFYRHFKEITGKTPSDFRN